MKKRFVISRLCLATALALVSAQQASAAPVIFTKLTGVLGSNSPNPAATGVWGADLSGFGGQLLSISIQDNSGMLGGSTGQVSGFDLDAIRLSYTACATAACVAAATPLNVFNFAAPDTVFTPGSQRPPTDPKLFGTGPGGNTVDNAVATLGAFDGVSSTLNPNHFLSLGDNGLITFNLTSPVSLANLWLYIGEVGDNGEVAASAITIQTTVPEPSTWAMMILGIGFAGAAMRRRQQVSLKYA